MITKKPEETQVNLDASGTLDSHVVVQTASVRGAPDAVFPKGINLRVLQLHSIDAGTNHMVLMIGRQAK